MARRLWPLLFLAACGTEPKRDAATPRDAAAKRPVERAARVAPAPDTAVFVARQAGEPLATVSAVMQLRVAAQDAEISVENAAGQQAMTGAVEGDRLEEIPGSRAMSVSAAAGDTAHGAWRATVTVPVLEGEHYLLELAPSTPRRDSALVELTADGVRLGSARAEMDAASNEGALFEVVLGRRALFLSPRIERIDIVPTCGTAHVIRSAGRADLFAQYEVIETRERGDIRIPPRADDAQFRSVSLRTRTRGGLRITYLGRELASAARPEACPE